MREREIVSSSAFGRKMTERYDKKRDMRGISYWGIGLREDGWAKKQAQSLENAGYVYSRAIPENPPAVFPREGGLQEKATGYTFPTSAHCDDENCELGHYPWADGTEHHEEEMA